jgi:hypothetical protein
VAFALTLPTAGTLVGQVNWKRPMEDYQVKANIRISPETGKFGMPLHVGGKYLVHPLNVNGDFCDIAFDLSVIGPLTPGKLYEDLSARFLNPIGKKGLLKLGEKYKLQVGELVVGEIQVTQLRFD